MKIDFFAYLRPERKLMVIESQEILFQPNGVISQPRGMMRLVRLEPLEEHAANDFATELQTSWLANRPPFLRPNDRVSRDICVAIAALVMSQQVAASLPGEECPIYNELELLQMAVLNANLYRRAVDAVASGEPEPGKDSSGPTCATQLCVAASPTPAS